MPPATPMPARPGSTLAHRGSAAGMAQCRCRTARRADRPGVPNLHQLRAARVRFSYHGNRPTLSAAPSVGDNAAMSAGDLEVGHHAGRVVFEDLAAIHPATRPVVGQPGDANPARSRGIAGIGGLRAWVLALGPRHRKGAGLWASHGPASAGALTRSSITCQTSLSSWFSFQMPYAVPSSTGGTATSPIAPLTAASTHSWPPRPMVS